MSEQTTISEKTKMPLSLVIVLMVGVVGGLTMLNSIRARVSEVNGSVLELRRVAGGFWTKGQMERWAHALDKANPTLRVPDPEIVKVNEDYQ